MNATFTTVDQYIDSFPESVMEILSSIRKIILENAPEAIESIAYGMPAYKVHKKPLVYFAAFDKHIGFYATPTGHEKFKDALSGYKQGRGSVQFPLQKPIPYDLIKDIVQFRVYEENQKTSLKTIT